MGNGIIVRDPFREFDNLVRRAFDTTPFGGFLDSGAGGFVPAAESRREGDDLVVRLELPGVDVTKDVDVEVQGRHLVISGERRDERDENTEHGRIQEFRYGSFRRAFTLGTEVDPDQVSATYDAGVLTVRVPNAYADSHSRKIEIGTSQPAAVEAKKDTVEA